MLDFGLGLNEKDGQGRQVDFGHRQEQLDFGHLGERQTKVGQVHFLQQKMTDMMTANRDIINAVPVTAAVTTPLAERTIKDDESLKKFTIMRTVQITDNVS